jgi:adenylate cyclase
VRLRASVGSAGHAALRGSRRARRRRAALLLAVGGALTGLVVIAYATDLFERQELNTVDTRFAIRGARRPPRNIVLVEVDAATFSALPGVQWPYPRTLDAAVIDHIVADRPRLVGVDIQFTEQPRHEHEDVALAESIYGATSAGVPVVLDTTETGPAGATRILGGNPQLLASIGVQPSSADFQTDPDGAIRQVTFELGGLRTFATVTAAAATRRPVRASLFGGRPAWIDYYGPTGTFPAVSFAGVLHGQVPRGFFTGKVVLVGVSDPSLQDLHATSVDPLMPGVELQADAVETVARGLPLRSAPVSVDAALILLLGMTAPLASLRLTPLRSLAVAVAAGGAFAVACQVAFDAGRILSFVYPLAALLMTASGSLGVHYTTAAFERERVRDLFSRFVPENVVSELLARSDDGLRLGGVQRVCTAMFTDLRGFTSFAEALAPDRVIAVLNEYLSSMSDAILDHGGTLVAYMGDGIFAVFGAPIESADHADQALAAAREMLHERLPKFNTWLRAEGLGEGFRMGIGLNSGLVMSGNVGSERRVEYAAIGDTTNTASRVEGMTKGTPHQLFFTEETRRLLRDPPADLAFVGERDVRGRQTAVRLWTLSADPDGSALEP